MYNYNLLTERDVWYYSFETCTLIIIIIIIMTKVMHLHAT